MSYPYHMGLWDKAQHEARMLATVRIATMKERDACARMLELRDSELLLMAGEMTAQELRTVKAVLAQRASAIRMRSNVEHQGPTAGLSRAVPLDGPVGPLAKE